MKRLVKVVIAISLLTPLLVGAQQQQGFQNPLGKDATVEKVIVLIINYLLGLIGILALAAIVWGSIRIIASFGNENAVATGKKIIFWAVIGLALAILSFFILRVVQDLLGA